MQNSVLSHIKLEEPTLEPWRSGDDPERDIAVLMSGGVDSSVTALLLKEQGWNVLGITMRIPVAEKCDTLRSCCGAEAGYVCRDLGIPHYFLDVREAFQELVIEPFRQSYLNGATPSPCIDCNHDLKFGVVWDFLEQAFGIRHLATGHYACVIHARDRSYLARAQDLSRDQSYFLYGVQSHRLPYLHFPLSDLPKQEVRERARQARLPVARKPDSMELCFAGESDYRNALGLDGALGGNIVDVNGHVLGQHDGIHNFTIGQRRGIRVAAAEALYVVAIRPQDQTIVVGSKEECLENRVSARRVNTLIPEYLVSGMSLFGKIRSQGTPVLCKIEKVSDDSLTVLFDEPQLAPATGQRLVLYDEQHRVVAGGVIV